MMAANSDFPPAYNTWNDSPAQNTTEPAVVLAIPNKCDNDTEVVSETVFASCFEDKKIRIRFMQKVLGITLLQLLAVAALMLIFFLNATNYNWYWAIRQNHANFIVVSILSYLFTLGYLIYCQEARWKTPYKYIFLAAYPLSFGFAVSTAFFVSDLGPVFMTWIYFCVVISALLVYSIVAYRSTEIDFTAKTGLHITIVVLVAAYVLTVPFIWVNGFIVLYCTLVVFLLCSYILNDLEAMVSRHYHRFEVTPADFVNGALIIHLDYRYMITRFLKSAKTVIV